MKNKDCIICKKAPKIRGKSYCGPCYWIKCAPYIEKYYGKRKEILQFKKQEGCCKCKEKRYWVLDFHHLNKESKEKEIYRIMGIPKLLKEIEKCIVFCSNCHRDFHFQEKFNNITLTDYIKL